MWAQPRDDRGVRRSGGSQRHGLFLPGRDHSGATARQKGVIYPSSGAVLISDLSPIPVFGKDLQRQTRGNVDPFDHVVRARSHPHVRALGCKRNEAWDRETRHRPYRLRDVGRVKSAGGMQHQSEGSAGRSNEPAVKRLPTTGSWP